jgi:hypothetical protein
MSKCQSSAGTAACLSESGAYAMVVVVHHVKAATISTAQEMSQTVFFWWALQQRNSIT